MTNAVLLTNHAVSSSQARACPEDPTFNQLQSLVKRICSVYNRVNKEQREVLSKDLQSLRAKMAEVLSKSDCKSDSRSESERRITKVYLKCLEEVQKAAEERGKSWSPKSAEEFNKAIVKRQKLEAEIKEMEKALGKGEASKSDLSIFVDLCRDIDRFNLGVPSLPNAITPDDFNRYHSESDLLLGKTAKLAVRQESSISTASSTATSPGYPRTVAASISTLSNASTSTPKTPSKSVISGILSSICDFFKGLQRHYISYKIGKLALKANILLKEMNSKDGLCYEKLKAFELELNRYLTKNEDKITPDEKAFLQERMCRLKEERLMAQADSMLEMKVSVFLSKQSEVETLINELDRLKQAYDGSVFTSLKHRNRRITAHIDALKRKRDTLKSEVTKRKALLAEIKSQFKDERQAKLVLVFIINSKDGFVTRPHFYSDEILNKVEQRFLNLEIDFSNSDFRNAKSILEEIKRSPTAAQNPLYYSAQCEADLKKMRMNIGESKSSLDKLETEERDFRNTITSLDQETIRLRERVAGIDKEVSKLADEATHLKEALGKKTEMEKEIAAITRQIQELQDKKAALVIKMKELQDKYARHTRDLVALQEENSISVLENALKEERKHLDVLTKTLENQKLDWERARRASLTSQAHLEERSAPYIAAQERQIRESESKIEKYEEEIQKRNELQKSRKENSEEIEKIEKEIRLLDQEIQPFDQRLKGLKQGYATQYESRKDHFDRASKRLSELEYTTMVALTAEKAVHQDRLNKIPSDKKQLQRKLVDAVSQKREIDIKIKEQEIEARRLEFLATMFFRLPAPDSQPAIRK